MCLLVSRPSLRLLAALLILIQTLATPAPLWANPTGGDIVAGSAAISSQGSTLNVITNTDRAVINWQGFSIGAGETTNIFQPGADSAVLNRVTTPDNPSAIYGQLNSNGNVFLVNPAGILIGPTGVINANGFTASVFDISNREFMAGGLLTFRGDSTASVVNQGAIYTGAGGVALLGHQVINSGLVSSAGGAITLAAGGSITLADGSRYIQADVKTLASGISETASLIRNSGTVRATGALKTGGEAYLVNPAGNILHDGTIKADQLAEAGRSGGSVKLEAAKGETRVEGNIDASGDTGGRVEVLGERVELAGAMIDATGTNGGGTVLVGGDFQGGNPDVLNAQHTTVDAASVLSADAMLEGDGGRVILWADGSLEFYGSITARGGELGGDGGFTEVSGLGSLTFHGLADLGATAGSGGQLLLDPTDMVIDPPMATAISTSLNFGSDVTMYTAAGGTDPGNITLTSGAVISWDNSSRLKLLAHQDIWLHGQITATADGSVTLVAGWDGTLPFVAASGTHGNNGGSVFVNRSDGTGTTGVAVGSRFGETNVAACDLILTGGNTTDAYAQLGFRADTGVNDFMIDSDIALALTGGIMARAGAGVGAYAQVGHGARFNAPNAGGAYRGDIQISAGADLAFSGGSNYCTYAQLGHGGYGASGSHSGQIEVTLDDSLTLAGSNISDRYALIGHGDQPGNDDTGKSVGGNVILRIGQGAELANAFVGHLMDQQGVYAGGNTYIAVGTQYFNGANTTDALVSDANSRIVSAPDTAGGQLRLYLPTRGSLQMADGAMLNGVDVATFTATTPFPNEQGGFQPFLGPYNVDLADGNFAFYFGVIELIVYANSGLSIYGQVPINPGLDLVSGTLNPGDTLESIGLTNHFNLTATSPAGSYTLNVDDAALDPTYELVDWRPGQFIINPALLTVNALGQVKIYGDDMTGQTPVLDAHFSVAGLQNGEVVNGVTLSSAGYAPTAPVAGGPYTIVPSNPTDSTGSGFDVNNYAITYHNGLLTVNPAALTILANDQFKRAGWDFSAGPSTEFTAVGLRNHETIGTVLLGSPGAPASAPAGVYPLYVVSTAGGTFNPANYVPLFVSGQLFVGQVGGEFAYDQYTRPRDQWRTLSYLLGSVHRGFNLGYGAKPQSDDGENLVELSSFDLFGP